MAITRTPIVDDDGTGTTGTVIDNAWKQEFYDQIDAVVAGGSTAVVVNGSGGTINNLALPSVDCAIVSLTNPPVTLNGFVSAREGQRVILRNSTVSANAVTLPNAAAGQGAPLFNIVSSGPTLLAAGGSATYVCISGFYVLVQHQQGHAIAVPYSAANYATQGGSSVWTVTGGSVLVHEYFLRGDQLTLTVRIENSNMTSGSSNVLAIVGLPYTLRTGGNYGLGLSNLANASGYGNMIVTPIATGLNVLRYDLAPFTAATNTFLLTAQLTATVS